MRPPAEHVDVDAMPLLRLRQVECVDLGPCLVPWQEIVDGVKNPHQQPAVTAWPDWTASVP